MHANDDSLGVRSASVSGQMRREDHLKSASLPDRLSSSGRFTILCSSSRKCPEMIAVPVDKIACRCRRVTQRARQRSALGNKPTQAKRFAVFRAIPKFFSLPKLNYTEKNRRPEGACSDTQGRWYRNKKSEDEKAE